MQLYDLESLPPSPIGLAVSSADGRALQHWLMQIDRFTQAILAVSSADGRALQQCKEQRMQAWQATCSILSGWTGFAAQRNFEAYGFDVPALQYPQRMDGLCSARCAAGHNDDCDACSILSGWTGFAAQACKPNAATIGRLQYPQRMDGLCSLAQRRRMALSPMPCSILSGWTGFAAGLSVVLCSSS